MLLKLGSSGDEVEMWQAFLKGRYPYSQVLIDGNFGPETEKATITFQKETGLTSDGIVGQSTFLKAKTFGFSTTNLGDLSNLAPLSPLERETTFGKFTYTSNPLPGNPENIKINQKWVSENITSIQIPELSNVNGAPKSGIIQCHKLIVPQIFSLFKTWSDQGLLNKILTWDGCWCPRFVRGSNITLSNHSWGTAFDINARWNPLGVNPPQIGAIGSVKELVKIAEEHGFFWGGNYSKRPDGMHFECVIIK